MIVQRWRLILSRSAEAPDLNARELLATWLAALEESGLRDPAAADPARVVPGAPIPVGLTSSGELVDLLLPERRTAADVRARVSAHLPTGYGLVDLHDVWPGEPALPGTIVAGDYRVEVAAPADAPPDEAPEDPAAIRDAVDRLLAAEHVERLRSRPERAGAANLRPLVIDVRVVDARTLWMRLCFDPALGTGRPEEVVAALGALADRPWIASRRHRERLWLRDEVQTPPPA